MKRIQNKKKIRDTILIITNGQTEKNYFNSITNSFTSMFKISIKFLNAQPDELVSYAKSLDLNQYNQIWCVFDIDDTYIEGHLIDAITEAEKNNIHIAFSNEAFEVWLLYHLTINISPSLTRKTYIKEINKLLQNNKCTTKYQKGNNELLKKEFIPKILQATEIAKKKYQNCEAEHQKLFMGNKNYPIWNWVSTTTVYQLIESLRLELK